MVKHFTHKDKRTTEAETENEADKQVFLEVRRNRPDRRKSCTDNNHLTDLGSDLDA